MIFLPKLKIEGGYKPTNTYQDQKNSLKELIVKMNSVLKTGFTTMIFLFNFKIVEAIRIHFEAKNSKIL